MNGDLRRETLSKVKHPLTGLQKEEQLLVLVAQCWVTHIKHDDDDYRLLDKDRLDGTEMEQHNA